MTQTNLPPDRVEKKFEMWEETYSVDNLAEMTVDNIESAELQFLNEVRRLKTEYRPGRLVTPEMAKIHGKEPLTQSEFREVRRLIGDKSDQMQMNFTRAKGRRKREREQREAEYKADVAGRVADAITNLSISFELPKLK